MKPHTRSFSIPLDRAGRSVDIRINEPPLKADNLSLATWGSAYVLASRLHLFEIPRGALEPATRQEQPKVLELGAGTGLCGLVASIIWRTSVILTDLAPIVPGLEINASLNSDLLLQNGADVCCGALDWSSPGDMRLSRPRSLSGSAEDTQQVLSPRTHKVDLILAADTVYSEEHPELLTQTISMWLKPGPLSRVLITYPARIAYLDQIRELWERLDDCGLEAVEEGKVSDVSHDWDEEAYYEWSVWKWR